MNVDNDTGISTLLFLEEFCHKDLQIAHIYIVARELSTHSLEIPNDAYMHATESNSNWLLITKRKLLKADWLKQ